MEKRDPRTVVAIILGGGAGTRLFPLTKRRAKPAVSTQFCTSIHNEFELQLLPNKYQQTIVMIVHIFRNRHLIFLI